jgi:hypothetical protein
MIFYRMTLNRHGTPLATVWYATLADAHQSAKSFPKHDRPHVYIDMLDIAVDKSGVLALLNADSLKVEAHRPLRAWDLTDRGGLREAPAQA